MAANIPLLMKVLSPKIVSKAVQTFDRATMVVVGACWTAAMLMMAFAVYTTILTVSSKHAAESALATEPSLPKMVRKGVDPRYAQSMVERLKRRYPDIGVTFERDLLRITTVDGTKFHEWLNSLSYIDTISPEYHWSIQKLCVGKCGGELMQAVLSGEQISFEVPQTGG